MPSTNNKRNRSSNWSESEKSLLKRLIKDKIYIIENKDVSSNNNQMKKAAWIEILQSFNQLNDTKRDLPQLLNQWRNTKNNIKKRNFEYRRNRNATGGGPPPPSPPPEDTEIMEILPNEFEVDNNIYDSDSLNIKKKINTHVNEPGCSSSSLFLQTETVSIQDNLNMDLPSLQPETVTVQVHSPKPDAVNKKKPEMGKIKKNKNRVKVSPGTPEHEKLFLLAKTAKEQQMSHQEEEHRKRLEIMEIEHKRRMEILDKEMEYWNKKLAE